MLQEQRTCQNCKQSFVIEPEDFAFYEKIKVPPPTWCPRCRAMRRMTFWNERSLFRKKDARTGQEVFSTYPEAAPVSVYDHDFWWSDGWDPMRYGKPYDFSRPFFEQFQELMRAVPWPARSIWRLENSDYCNNASRIKNCYLCFDCDESDGCLYGTDFRYSKDSIDFHHADRVELCYEVLSCDRSYRTFFSVESDDCQDVWFSKECYDCRDCFGCVNLRHKQYYVFNEPCTKEEYHARLASFRLDSYRSLLEMKRRVHAFWSGFPVKYMRGFHNERAVGEYVYHSKNVRYCYQQLETKDMKYSQRIVASANSYDYTHWGDHSELMYEAVTCGEGCRNVKYCFECWPACQDAEYSMHCHSSDHLFGCVGLKKKSYCILNAQYTREEYEALREKIIRHMSVLPYKGVRGNMYTYGEFFPPEFSPLAYNETIASDFFPLSEQEAGEKGFSWRVPHLKEFEITLPADELPDSVKEAPEVICKEQIGCRSCKRAYRILPREFAFYVHCGIPFPRLCHQCRFRERIAFRNPIAWYRRTCMCKGILGERIATGGGYRNITSHFHGDAPCPSEFETSYAPDRKEVVYCETCYNAEVA